MNWRCNKCGSIIVAVNITKHTIDENKSHEDLYDEQYYYECSSCDNEGYELENIASLR